MAKGGGRVGEGQAGVVTCPAQVAKERLIFVGAGVWRYQTGTDSPDMRAAARRSESYDTARRDLGMRPGDVVLVHDGAEAVLVAV